MNAVIEKKISKQRKKKIRFVLYDELKFQRRNDEGFSWYEGNRGNYLIQRANVSGKNKPVAKMFLNRKYLTGIFRTPDANSFSGDIKQGKRRVFLKIEFTGQSLKLLEKKIE